MEAGPVSWGMGKVKLCRGWTDKCEPDPDFEAWFLLDVTTADISSCLWPGPIHLFSVNCLLS